MKKLMFYFLNALKAVNNQCKSFTEWSVKSVAFLLCIWEALDSVLSLEAGYLDLSCSWVFSFPPGIC
jgi:hypothetical protein